MADLLKKFDDKRQQGGTLATDQLLNAFYLVTQGRTFRRARIAPPLENIVLLRAGCAVSRSLAGLLRSLRQAGLDFIDAEAALDSLWLGLQMQARQARERRAPSATEPADGGAPPPGDQPFHQRDAVAGDARVSLLSIAAGRASALPAERAAQRARADVPRADAAASGRVLTLPRAAALPESRELVKALRPLRRRVASPGSRHARPRHDKSVARRRKTSGSRALPRRASAGSTSCWWRTTGSR